jgi:hypothetical protein
VLEAYSIDNPSPREGIALGLPTRLMTHQLMIGATT